MKSNNKIDDNQSRIYVARRPLNILLLEDIPFIHKNLIKGDVAHSAILY